MELYPAFIVHAVSGRARIRIPAKRGDGLFFSTAEAGLRGCEGVKDVQINARAGSVLINYSTDASLKTIADFARRRRLFNLSGDHQAPMKTVSEVFAWQMRQADRMITAGSRGYLDSQSIFFLLFLGLGLLQTWRGRIMQPAIPLLWRALEILKDVK